MECNWIEPEKEESYISAHQSFLKRLAGDSVSVLIACEDVIYYIAAFMAAKKLGKTIFLGSHDWSSGQLDDFCAQYGADVALGIELPEGAGALNLAFHQGLIMVPTGGSGGVLKFAMHTYENLEISAKAFHRHLKIKDSNWVSLLPVFHLSGLMPYMRAKVSKGVCLARDRHMLDLNERYETPGSWFVSLVPTLLLSLIEQPNALDWLRQFDGVIVGGAALSESLYQAALAKGINVRKTYGATESASMVTLQRSSSDGGSGAMLPHASIEETGQGLRLSSESLFLGYYPEEPQVCNGWFSGDEGNIDKTGCVSINGRIDRIINSGAEKVAPWEVERLIMDTGFFSSCAVLGVQDKLWGECVSVAYVPNSPRVNIAQVKASLKDSCASYMIPKRWLELESMPLLQSNKVDYSAILALFEGI